MVIEEGTATVEVPETDIEELNQKLAEEVAEFIARQVLERGATFKDS